MRPETARRLAKAERFLRQVTASDATVTPDGVVHLSYYAMFHAAAAVLIERTGSAPKTHSAMVGQFSRMANSIGREAGLMARRFNKAEDWRITADYDEEPSVEGNDAASVRADALEFVGFCRRLLGG